jgi:hypothetical protein
MLNPKKSAKYYLKKANYNREEAKDLVYKQFDRITEKLPYGLQWINKSAYYHDVIELIDNILIIKLQNHKPHDTIT